MSYDVDQDDVPDAASAADLAFAARMAEIHTVLPGRVVAYDSAAQRVDVRPVVRRPVPRADGGVLLEELPVVRSVPVILPGGASFFLHVPLAAGDHVLLLCADLDPARFLETGEPSDPVDHRRHHLAHAFALPVVRPRADVLSPDPGAVALIIGKEGGPRIVVSETPSARIKVGASATQKAVRAANLDQHLTKIALGLDALSALIAGVPTPEPNYGAAAKAALDGTAPIAATLVEVE